MIGKPTEHKKAIQRLNSSNTVTGNTTLSKNFHGTNARFLKHHDYHFFVAIDGTWDRNRIQVSFFSDNNSEENLLVGGSLAIDFWVYMPDGRARIDKADRGKLSFYYDILQERLSGTLEFAVDYDDGTLAYTFTGGKFDVNFPFEGTTHCCQDL